MPGSEGMKSVVGRRSRLVAELQEMGGAMSRWALSHCENFPVMKAGPQCNQWMLLNNFKKIVLLGSLDLSHPWKKKYSIGETGNSAIK